MNFERYEFNGFVGIFENYFQNKFINELLAYYNSINDLNISNKHQPPRHWKDDEQLYMLDPSRIQTVQPHYVNEFFTVLWEKIIPIYANKFSILQEKSLEADQLKMKKIIPGGGFHQWHYEALGADSKRRLVVQLYMNDIDEAGETEFLYQNIRINPKKNRLLVWPSDWTHTHRGNPPIGTTDKYILTTWLLEADRDVHERSRI